MQTAGPVATMKTVRDVKMISTNISKEEWEKKLREVKLKKASHQNSLNYGCRDLNKLVMDYLIAEGYQDAAEKFQHESGTEPSIDLCHLSDRMSIRAAIQQGDILEGIHKVNKFDPEILDKNPTLYFHLQQQRLIELIRKGDIKAALTFAQEELAPRAQENPEFLAELERTMALLVFEDFSQSPDADLLTNKQRQKTASELNATILDSQCIDKDPKVYTLLKMIYWAQKQLESKNVRFPLITNLETAELETKHIPVVKDEIFVDQNMFDLNADEVTEVTDE